MTVHIQREATAVSESWLCCRLINTATTPCTAAAACVPVSQAWCSVPVKKRVLASCEHDVHVLCACFYTSWLMQVCRQAALPTLLSIMAQVSVSTSCTASPTCVSIVHNFPASALVAQLVKGIADVGHGDISEWSGVTLTPNQGCHLRDTGGTTFH